MLKWGLDRSKSPGSASHLRSAAIQSPNQCLPQWLQRAKEKMSWGAPLKKNLQWPVQSHDMPCRWHCWFGRDIELRFPGAVLLIIAVEMIKHGIFLWTQPVSKCLSCCRSVWVCLGQIPPSPGPWWLTRLWHRHEVQRLGSTLRDQKGRI